MTKMEIGLLILLLSPLPDIVYIYIRGKLKDRHNKDK